MQFHQPSNNVLERNEGSLLPFKVHVPQAYGDSFRIIDSAGVLESIDVPSPPSAFPVLESLTSEGKVLAILPELLSPSNLRSRYNCSAPNIAVGTVVLVRHGREEHKSCQSI